MSNGNGVADTLTHAAEDVAEKAKEIVAEVKKRANAVAKSAKKSAQDAEKTVTKRVTPGIGAGGLLEKMKYPAYTYEGVDPGFAELDLDQYDAVADAIAWSRSLSLVRRGFGAEVHLERPWEDNVERASPHAYCTRSPTH